MADADPPVTPQDVVQAGFCPLGLRAWLDHYKIDRRRFIAGEVRASEIEATGDANGMRAAAVARKRAE